MLFNFLVQCFTDGTCFWIGGVMCLIGSLQVQVTTVQTNSSFLLHSQNSSLNVYFKCIDKGINILLLAIKAQ